MKNKIKQAQQMREMRLICKIAFVTNKTSDTFELSNATMFLFVHHGQKIYNMDTVLHGKIFGWLSSVA